MSVHRAPFLGVVLAVLALVIPALARAQTADEKVLAAYRLNVSDVRKLGAVFDRLVDLAKNPAMRKKFAEVDAKDDGDKRTVTQMAAVVDRMPEYRRAVESSGLTTRQYVVTLLSFMEATTIASMMDARGARKLTEVPAGVSKENVAFARQNKAEVARIAAKIEALSKLIDTDEENDKSPPARR